jgi:hypothetical protein
MIRRKHLIALSLVLTFSLLLTGCNLFGPAAVPTIDPLIQQATIDAAIIQTMQAVAVVQTSTAAALPVSTNTVAPTPEPLPTSTLAPTWTAVPVIIIPTNTFVPVIPTKTKTPTPAAYSCSLISTAPASGTKINLNTDFDAAWKVKNTGTKVWEVGYLDLKYVSGTKMQTGADIYDVSTAVAPGGEITVIVDMKAPGTAGKYTASWVLVIEGTTLCTLPVNIEAVTP